jgi:hypothetical protein
VAALKWNEWQLSSGLGGSFALEYAGKFHNLIKGKNFPSAEDIDEALKNRAANKFLANDCD